MNQAMIFPMVDPKQSIPPRPIAPGDVVAAFSTALDEWTVAQVINLKPNIKKAGVLDLDWSGPEPTSVAELGELSPLRLTHHSWNGKLSYCNYEWVLPRSYKVIGTLPLLHDQPSNRYSSGWRIGAQLALQRRWDRGDQGEPTEPWKVEYTGAEINRVLDEQTAPRPEITQLRIWHIASLDCGRLVQHFPHLTELSMHGDLGLLSAAARLNELASLQRIDISDLFGMNKHDRLLPQRLPELEALYLDGIPTEYATATRSTWRPEIPNGTYVDIVHARKQEWVAENRNNPLRNWDGREHISPARYKKSVTQYKLTRRAIMTVLSEQSCDDRPNRLVEIGREYGEAFNKLDQPTPFIETEEREDLFAALDHIVHEAASSLGPDLAWAQDSLISGVESVRDW